MTSKIIVDCSTGEVQEIALTAEEIKEREAMAAQYVADKAEKEAEAKIKADAKAALLKKLGITEAEAELLLA